MKHVIIFFILITWACSTSEKKQEQGSTPEIGAALDAKTFKEKFTSEPNAVLLDVRTPGEVAEGAIPGAMNIDFSAPDFTEKISALDKEKSYFVYCKGGGRSSKTADEMKEVGFTKVYNLEGGYDAWVGSGFETTVP